MKLLIANWKMAPDTAVEAVRLAKATSIISKKYKKHLSVIACVPYIYLTTVKKAAPALILGAQDVAPGTNVAATGSIGAMMLKGNKVSYAIVGHSECRSSGDTNELVKTKLDRLMEKKLTPILCVGEKTRDDRGWYLSAVKDQVESALAGLARPELKRLVIAYEPVWAIGAGAEREATPDECREMIMFVRKLITDLYDARTAQSMTIVYGGSVSEDNAALFVADGCADGLLVGRVSLDSKRLHKLAHNSIAA